MNMPKVTCKSSTFTSNPSCPGETSCELQFDKHFFFLQVGGEAVNLIARDKPADVYTSIADR